jgi:hypothetical protein
MKKAKSVRKKNIKIAKCNDASNEIAAKLSHRSSELIFKGGGMPYGCNEGHSNGLEFAKALTNLPDYSSFASREAEKQLGPFVYDLDDAKIFDHEITTRGPYELDDGAVY